MRENGLPRLMTWRWAPCVALVLGSVSFIAFALVAIPDRIGHVNAESSNDGLHLGAALARTQPTPASPDDWSGDTTNTAAATPSPGVRSPSSVTQNADGSFPKRGFSPPLERPEPPAVSAPPPQPIQLNVPPPVPTPPPPPAAPPQTPPPVAPQAEVAPQAAPAPPQVETPPPSAEQAPAPPTPAN
jgi:outer membrane biosynthesis protein TonB